MDCTLGGKKKKVSRTQYGHLWRPCCGVEAASLPSSIFPTPLTEAKTKTAKCLEFMCFVPRDHNISDEWSGSRLKLSLAWPGGSTYYTTGNIIRCRKDGWDCVFDERSSRMMFHRNSYQDLSLAEPSGGGGRVT